MTHFAKTKTGYTISDEAGQKVQLTPEQAYELLQWLYDRRDELFTSLHPDLPSWVTPEISQAWKKARSSVEAFNREHPFVSSEQKEDNKEYSDEHL